MLRRGEVGWGALNDHGNYFLIMEKSWKNHGILFLNFCGNPAQSTHPVRRVLWKELLEEVIHITPLCSLLHTLLKDKCMCLQDDGKL